MRATTALTRFDVIRLWTPLAFTWVVMGLEAPLLTAVIARLPDPALNLAAYGIAIGLLLFCESPVLIIVSVAIALVEGPESMRRVWRFCCWNAIAVFLIMLLLALPWVFERSVGLFMVLTPEMSEQVRMSVLILAPVPLAVAYRRFFQGLLIRAGRTRSVAWGTVGRIAAIVLGASAFFHWSLISGVAIGSWALLIGVSAEAVFCRWAARGVVREISARPPSPDVAALTVRTIASFFYPLAFSTLIVLTIQPVVCAFLSRSEMALESLALFPVLSALAVIFRSCGLAFQEAAIAILRSDDKNLRVVRESCWIIGVGSSIGLGAIVLTPLARVWFEDFGGLTPQLVSMSRLPAALLVISPFITTWVCFERAFCIALGRTKLTMLSGAVELAGVALALYLGIEILHVVGIVSASVALVAAGAASGFALAYFRKAESAERAAPGV